MTGGDALDHLIDQARRLRDSGDLDGAWTACAEVARLSRAGGSTDHLVEAALVLRPPDGYWLRGRVHALAREALARAPIDDPRQRLLVAQVAATRDPHAAPGGTADRADLVDPEASFLRMRAEMTALQHPTRVALRLAIADRAIGLGEATGVMEYEAWGRRWRMDAAAELGRPTDLDAERSSVAPLVDVLGDEWRSWLLLTRASTKLLEGSFGAAADLVDRARDVGGSSGIASFFHLVFATELAAWTGRDAGAVADAVGQVTEHLPYQARGWLAVALHNAGDLEGARHIWRGLRDHVLQVPEDSAEWLIAAVGHAAMCEAFQDTEIAGALYERLLPVEDYCAVALANAPHHGPVSLTLGRLALVLGRSEQARTHLESALVVSTRLQAVPHLAVAHLALAQSWSPGSRRRSEHAARAVELARTIGASSLISRALALVEVPTRDERLTPREAEVAALVADGLTNGAIAQRLVLSERTVENHVAHALHKLDLPSRAALAAHVHRRP